MEFLSKVVVDVRARGSVALLLGVFAIAGCGTSNSPGTATATPTFSPAGGTFNASQIVTITDTTKGAVLYCTTDGTAPTTSSPQCSQPTTVFKSEYLQAIAMAPGMSASSIASAGYTIDLMAAATPTLSPAGGTFNSTQTVTISDPTTGANLYYTIDGTVPSASSTLYTGPVVVSKTQTISAIAVASGFNNSGVASATYTINPVAATPVFTPAGGTYTAAQLVTISDTTTGAAIHYTIDGTVPSASSALYSGPVTVSASETLNAIAIAPNFTDSAIGSAAYIISPPAATPVFSPGAGSYNSIQTVTINDATPGAAIYYTVDGSAPTSGSTLYNGPVAVAKSETINAIAIAPGYTNSTVATAAYTITLTTATPVFSVAAGTYNAVQTVAITDATPASAIYYTTNGSTPTSGSTAYTGPITISATETINAIAIAPGYNNSAVATAAYTITLTAATPVFSVAAGSYNTVQTVSISDATSGAAIYYTTNGSTPTNASALYSGPVTISSTETLSAIAILPGYNNSAVATAAYTINLSAAATPTFSPVAGTYTSAQTVTISDATAGATVYYTIDGSSPTSGSTKYVAPVSVGATETLKAIAVATGFTDSGVGTAVYTINLPATATPTFSLAAGTYVGTQTLTISDATTGAVIYYTLDGSTPTASSMQYTAPIAVSATETLKAIAIAPGDSPSGVASASFTISAGNASLQGTVLSGTLPVKGSQVQLYVAGLTGYGSAGTAQLGTPVLTDSIGAFTFHYNCAASPGDLVYLVATGGDTGAGENAGLELMAALGPCGNLTASTNLVVNEVTTVASAYALSAFITTAPNVGSSATNYVGLKNAFAAVNNLVDPTTGNALTITPAYASHPVPYLNSSTVPQSRIDTLANILNGCVNSNGGTCANLFSAATPTGGTAPANTLQAMVDIAQNPGTNVAALFGLASPTGPFQPMLAGAPGDWTLALTFTGGGLGIPPGTVADTGEGPINNDALAIDPKGNIWVAATRESSVSSLAAPPVVAKFNNLGEPLTPATSLSTASPPVVTIGGYTGIQASVLLSNPTTIATDPSGFVWLSDTADYKIDPSFVAAPQTSSAGFSGPIAYPIVIDGSGNVWGKVTYMSGMNLLTGLGEVAGDFSVLLTGANGQSTFGSGPAYNSLSNLTFDSNGNLWAFDSLANNLQDLYQIDSTTGNITFDAFPGGVAAPPAGLNASTLVADGSGNIYGCADATGTNLNVFNNGALTHTYPLNAGRGCSTQLVLDGQGHIFAITTNFIFGQAPTIDEYSTTGMQISPANGYTGSSTGEPATISLSAFQVYPSSAAIDASGNLWVLNNGTNGILGYDADFNPINDFGNVLVEYIGIGAPVVTPNSLALQNGTLGARP